MFKKWLTNNFYFWGGFVGILISLNIAYLNYFDRGKCIGGGRLGTQLCGEDIYIYCSLIILISIIAMWGGTKFSKK